MAGVMLVRKPRDIRVRRFRLNLYDPAVLHEATVRRPQRSPVTSIQAVRKSHPVATHFS